MPTCIQSAGVFRGHALLFFESSSGGCCKVLYVVLGGMVSTIHVGYMYTKLLIFETHSPKSLDVLNVRVLAGSALFLQSWRRKYGGISILHSLPTSFFEMLKPYNSVAGGRQLKQYNSVAGGRLGAEILALGT